MSRLTGTDFLYARNDVNLVIVNDRGGMISYGTGCDEYKDYKALLRQWYPDAKEIKDIKKLDEIANQRCAAYMGSKSTVMPASLKNEDIEEKPSQLRLL